MKKTYLLLVAFLILIYAIIATTLYLKAASIGRMPVTYAFIKVLLYAIPLILILSSILAFLSTIEDAHNKGFYIIVIVFLLSAGMLFASQSLDNYTFMECVEPSMVPQSMQDDFSEY